MAATPVKATRSKWTKAAKLLAADLTLMALRLLCEWLHAQS